MSIITAMRMVSGLSGGTMNTAQLTAALATPAGAAGWKAAVHSPSMARQLLQEPTARTAWMASAEAVKMAVLSREFMQEWFDHRDALDKLMVTATSVTAMLASSEARIALWNSDKALRALGVSSVAVTAAFASVELKSTNISGLSSSSSAPPTAWFPGDFGRIVAFGWSGSNSGTLTLTGARASSRQPASFEVAAGNDARSVFLLPLEGPVTIKSSYPSTVYLKYFRAD